VRPRHPRHRRAECRFRRHSVPRWHRARRPGQREAPLRSILHANGRRRSAVTLVGTDASRTAGEGPSTPRRRPRRRLRVVNWKPSRSTAIFLGLLPFILIIIVYAVASADRLAVNPQDRLLPSLGSMWDAFRTYAFTPDQRSGDYLLWTDTLASLKRLVTAL